RHGYALFARGASFHRHQRRPLRADRPDSRPGRTGPCRTRRHTSSPRRHGKELLTTGLLPGLSLDVVATRLIRRRFPGATMAARESFPWAPRPNQPKFLISAQQIALTARITDRRFSGKEGRPRCRR